MFAVIKTGGKQYKVFENDKLVVEKLQGDLGEIIKLDEVLLIDKGEKVPVIGRPFIENASVFAEVVDQAKSKKVVIFKKKRRKNHRRTKGHRQEQTILKILEISSTGKQTVSVAKKPSKKVVKDKDSVDPKLKAKGKLKKEDNSPEPLIKKKDAKGKITKKEVENKKSKKVEDVKTEKVKAKKDGT